MKKLVVFLILIIIIPNFVYTQTIKNIDFISPFHDGVAAVKKANQWGFINLKGELIINFRDDLVSSFIDGAKYPYFSDGRCLISEKRNEVTYFGYINKTGETVIKPEFLNANNFYTNLAIVLKLNVEHVGNNPVLNKNIVYYKYIEVIIDSDGFIKEYLSDPINVVLDKKFLPSPPPITSKFISDDLIAIKDNKKTWTVKRINNI